MKKQVRKISIKNIFISIVLAFIVLSIFSFFYCKIPTSSINKDGYTDYVLASNSIYIKANEGIGFGKTNNEGFSNINDYNGNADVLFMGSSHVEAQNVPINMSMSNLLNSYLSELEVYNIGVSGHSFKTQVSNLNSALETYNPKYVILETGNISLSDDYIKQIINGSIQEIAGNMSTLTSLLYKNPLFRILISQLTELSVVDANNKIDEANTDVVLEDFNQKLYDELLKYIRDIAEKNNCKVIIMYHPSYTIDDGGNMIFKTSELSKKFSTLCENNGIYYLDMANRYLQEYEESYTVPNGFINGPVNVGHLNIDGHRMIADELYKLIKEIDK